MVSGSVGDRHVSGRLSAATVSGELSESSINGAIVATSIMGQVSAASILGALSVAMVSGEVVAGGDIVMPPSFDGPYEANARFVAQTIPTRMRYMEQDFEIHAINYTEAPNDGGGFTITIGG